MSSTPELLGAIAMAYGVGAALTVLLQARQMLKRHASCDISARFFTAYVGGYAIWLAYGVSIGSWPIIVVHVIGLACGAFTLAVALAMRGSLLHPRSWNSCRVELSALESEANR